MLALKQFIERLQAAHLRSCLAHGRLSALAILPNCKRFFSIQLFSPINWPAESLELTKPSTQSLRLEAFELAMNHSLRIWLSVSVENFPIAVKLCIELFTASTLTGLLSWSVYSNLFYFKRVRGRIKRCFGQAPDCI